MSATLPRPTGFWGATMSVYSYQFDVAQQNLAKNRLARWHLPPERVGDKLIATARMGNVFKPGVEIHRKIRSEDSIFTIGSCFARELENALSKLGFAVLSLRKDPWGGDPNITHGYTNRYNTASIYNELRWAAGDPFPESGFVETMPDRFFDLHSHPVVGARERGEVSQLRRELISHFAKAYEADVITVTLGLIEAWFDKENDTYINFAPVFADPSSLGRRLQASRFEFRVMSFEENMRYLENIYSLLEKHNPNATIFVTVSPVNLMATFSTRDVVVANCFSKSMLRTCAETWKQMHPDRVQYFPSYEMATLSDRALVYHQDGMHIKMEFVQQIMGYFKEVALG